MPEGRAWRWAVLAGAVAAAGGMVLLCCTIEPQGRPPPGDRVPSADCARCHPQIHADWRASRHARAHVGAHYQAARRTLTAAEGELCLRCHSPNLAAAGNPTDGDQRRRRIAEAIDCRSCHAAGLTDPKLRNVMRGPHAQCATDAHGCRQDTSLGRGGSCRPCHELDGPVLSPGAAGRFPVFSTFTEAALAGGLHKGRDCLECHMAPAGGHAATGGPRRAAVNSHALDGGTSRRALRFALDCRLQTRWLDEQLEVRIAITNRGAAHHVPTGLPGRRLEVVATAYGEDGRVLGTQSWWLGRVLTAGGAVVPFFRATRQASDDRLAPGQSRRFRWLIGRAATRRVVAEVRYYPLAPAVAKALGRPANRTTIVRREEQLP
jgi:hypothetical protein